MSNPFKDNTKISISTALVAPDSWGCFTEGYYWSSKILLEHVLNSPDFQNKWVSYAILFNIRHYYELSLKDILFHLGHIQDEKFIKITHSLSILLKIVEEEAKKYYQNNKDRLGIFLIINDIEDDIESIKREMNFFISYDDDSFNFRYPYTTRDVPSNNKQIDFNCIDIYNSLKKCRKLLTKLSGQLMCDKKNPIFNKPKDN